MSLYACMKNSIRNTQYASRNTSHSICDLLQLCIQTMWDILRLQFTQCATTTLATKASSIRPYYSIIFFIALDSKPSIIHR